MSYKSWWKRIWSGDKGKVDPVVELIRESVLVAEYAVAAAKLQDSGLFAKLAAAEALPPEQRFWSNSVVNELRAELAKSRVDVPYAVVLALKAGWRPQKDRLSDMAKNLGFVLASLLLMFAVGYSTLTYNHGAQVFKELSAMRERQPGLLFGRLERQIHLAERKLDSRTPREVDAKASASSDGIATVASVAAGHGERSFVQDAIPNGAAGGHSEAGDVLPASVSAQLETFLTQDASFQYVYDLSALDKQLKLLEDQSDDFLRQADYQLYLPTAAYQSLSQAWSVARERLCAVSFMGWASCSLGQTSPTVGDAQIVKNYTLQYRSLSAYDSKNFCRDIKYIQAAKKNGWSAKAIATIEDAPDFERMTFLQSSNYLFDDALGIDTTELMLQNCRLNLTYLSQTIPNIVDLQSKVESRLSSYSFIALPALYGALGSLMYFMRRIIDPLLPNPTLSRMISRVALGALAGMSLAWLWDGMFDSEEARGTVGFGLFIFAFVCGFAIDVFFSLLQHLVTLATNAVERIGVPAAPVQTPSERKALPQTDSPTGAATL